MFERFKGSARQVVITARQVAIEAGVDEVDSADLLVALVRVPDEITGRLLAGHGLTSDDLIGEFHRTRRRGGLSDADAAALSTLGVDVDQVISSIKESLGEAAMAPRTRKRHFLGAKGHVRFSVEAKRTLEQCLREAIRRDHKYIGAEHMLLALLSGRSVAADALASRGITYAGVNAALAQAS